MYKSMAFATKGQVEMHCQDLARCLGLDPPLYCITAQAELTSLRVTKLTLEMSKLRRAWKYVTPGTPTAR